MNRYVPDTSVVVKWFSRHDENDLARALSFREKVLNGECSITIPSLLFYELANALRFNPNLSAEDVDDATASIFDMEFDVRESSAEILIPTVQIAYAHNITVYDACFLATARLAQATFITADDRLYERIRGAEDVVLLRAWGEK
jgi:predicted nucleic acid-binding protein